MLRVIAVPSELSDRILKGAVWVIALRTATRLLGLVSLMTLARILNPEDYGLIALAGVFAGAIQLLSSLNFEIWLIRHPQSERDHYDTVWTLSIIRGIVTGAAIVVLAHPVGVFFDEPRLAAVLLVLAIGHVARGFQNVGVIDFQKDLDFDKDSVFLGASKVCGFIVAVVVALALRSYWALVAGILAEQMCKVALSYSMHRYRPKLSLASWHDAFEFSKWLLVSNLLSFSFRRGDAFILGKLVSSQSLGLYTVARELANLTSTEIVMPIRRVLLPAYSKLTTDPVTIRQSFLDGLGLILLFGIPCAVGIGLTADPLVKLVLGEKWLDAIPLVQTLVLYGLSAVGLANQGPLLLALGRTRLYTMLNIFGVALLLPSFAWAASQFGVIGGAWAASISSMFFFFASLVVTMLVTRATAEDIMRRVWRPIAATAMMAAVVLFAQAQIQENNYWPIAELSVCGSIGAFIYVVTNYSLWRLSGSPSGAEHLVRNVVLGWRVRR